MQVHPTHNSTDVDGQCVAKGKENIIKSNDDNDKNKKERIKERIEGDEKEMQVTSSCSRTRMFFRQSGSRNVTITNYFPCNIRTINNDVS